MDKLILQLTHDNNLFEEQWPDTFTQIEEATIPDDSKLVLNALVDYILTEPINPSPYDGKYFFITMIIDQLINNEITIDINDLINAFIRILNSSRTDQWHLNFLETIYRNFRMGEQLSSIPLKTNLIEQILKSLQNKIFIFNSEEESEKWQIFLTEYIFSNSTDNTNTLNQQNILTNMQTTFQQFYKHAIQQSPKSSVWSQIATVLNESSSELFDNQINLLSDFKNTNELFSKIEQLILENKYHDVSKFINRNLSSIDLEGLLRLIIRLCPIVEDRNLFCSEILISFISILEDLPIKKNFALIFFDLTLSILKLQVLDAPDLSFRLLRKKDFYPWKDLIDGLIDLIKTCISYETIIDKEIFSKLNELENIIDLISERAKIYPKISESIQSIVVDAILRWSNNQFKGSNHVYRIGKSLLNLINLQQINEDICLKFIEVLQNRINYDSEEINNKIQSFFNKMSDHLGEFIEQLKRLSHNIHSKLSNLFLSILDHSLYDEEQNMTFEHVTLVCIIFKTASTIYNENDIRLYESFLDRMYNEAKNENKTILYQWWTGFWMITGIKLQNVANDHIQQFLDYTFTTKDMTLTALLLTLSMQRPELFYNHFDKLVDTLLIDNGEYLSSLTTIFSLIVKQYPEIVLLKHINQIFSSLEAIPFNDYISMIIQTLSSVANCHPYLFDNYREKLLNLIIEKQNLLIFECFKKYIISSIIIINTENQANEYLNLLIDILKNKKFSNDIQKEIFYTCLLVGLKYKQILVHRRDDFVKLGSNLLINYIDDTTTSKINESMIRKAQEEIELIEQKINIKDEKSNRNNIPSWGREVTKLLNQRSNNDWRLLGKHLGFSSSEIKHWAMQTDPCMALLNEWFLTHKTDEAIYSLLKVLSEINRHDVEQIIRQAVLTTGQIIPNNLSVNLKRLPPIFLSFHSSRQISITKLKDRLKEAGYACQMYDEQIGINTIDTYIRGAKVVVCCINTLYVQSENCSKQFHSILNMKKPFILLYMEEQTWPPEGTLKSILCDYPYIQFSNDWSENKFIELLSQIRYYIAPDPVMISEEYRNWFVPRLDNLIFLKSSNDHNENIPLSFNNIPLIVLHPQIIISYQWDCQKDVLNLYKQLTQLGYRLWLDIFQMGGGDSLLEKYNIAIHQSLCLLACITPKYIKSINCQHELSLATSLNKPIIPLLLEETNSWPPSGLELSAFAGKSYIDFRNSNGNDRWTGKQFEMLLAQLKKIAPNVHTDKPRHVLEMQRPISASRNNNNNNTDIDQQPKRISSAPIIPKSRACSLM